MNELDGVLALLQDIKELLYGAALLLLGGMLSLPALLLGSWFALLLFLSIPLTLSGLLYIRHGWRTHEVVEKQD